MATQQASKVDLYSYKEGWSNNSLSIIKDSYSGKVYGEKSFSDLQKNIEAATRYFTDIVSRATDGSYMNQYLNQVKHEGTADYGSAGVNKLTPLQEAQNGLSILQANTITEDNYVQKDKMLASYEKYGDNWNKFFEGSYKNPRLDEANKSLTIKPSQSSDLSIPSSKTKTPRLTGTGVSAPSATTNNPFGTLDAGLNI